VPPRTHDRPRRCPSHFTSPPDARSQRSSLDRPRGRHTSIANVSFDFFFFLPLRLSVFFSLSFFFARIRRRSNEIPKFIIPFSAVVSERGPAANTHQETRNRNGRIFGLVHRRA
jgi:hypothetical protein